MSRQAGKPRNPAAKRQTRTLAKGEHSLEQQSLTRELKADHILADSTHHSRLLSKQDTSDIQASVQQLQLEADRLKTINSKTRSKQLETVEETHSKQTSSEGVEDETHSRLGSMDTHLYAEISSPFNTSMLAKSPFQVEQPPSIQINNTPPFVNPQFQINPPPAIPNVAAGPIGFLAMMQAMFAQQSLANRQQQEAMFAHQTQVSKQQAEANQQLPLMLAKSLDRQLDQHDKQLLYQTSIAERQAIADARTSIKTMREGTNIVQYFEHFETELDDAKIPLEKWKQILVSKLSTKADKVCAHLIHSEAIYQDMKRHLLANIGPSADELCNIVHGASHTEFQDKTEAQKLQHAKYISERYFLGIKQDNNNIIEYMAVRLYKFHCHRRFSHTIKLSKSHSFAELLEMATSFDSQLDYEKVTKQHHSHTKSSHKRITCDFCRKTGHSETECFKKQGLNKINPSHKPYKPYNNDSQQSGNAKQHKTNHKEAGVKSRPVVINWSRTDSTVNSIKGNINGHEAEVVIDTGAQITVVPGKFVYSDNLTGETVSILGVNGDPMPYQTACIPITVQNKTKYETVAVAPEDQLNAKVLLSVLMDKTITDNLLNKYFQTEETKEVLATTRSKHSNKPPISYVKQLQTSYNEDDRASDLSYHSSSDSESSDIEADITSDETIPDKPCAPVVNHLNLSSLPSSPLQPQNQTQLIPEPYSSTPTPEPYSSTSTPEPYSSTPTPEPYSSPPNLEPYSSNSEHNNTLTEPYSSELHPNKILQSDSPDVNLNEITEELPELPTLSKGNNTQVLNDQTKVDHTLKTIRGLAHHSKNGYAWENGLLIHMTTDHVLGERKRLVIPKPQRQSLIKLAHNKSGHFSLTKTKSILNDKFTWPGVSTDVRDYILSCDTCKKFNKHTHKPAPYHTRPVITEPFDEIALDIIGPLPRSHQRYRFALTAICMASRWPEVYPIKDTKAENIVSALIEFLARNGIPSKILTDQGSQFTSEVMAQTCQLLGITHITTVPYRPQGNGILEHFHGTLKPLLAKVASNKVDWVQFLPLALSAIRAIPCRSTGFSPSEVVFGRNSRNILDIVFEGWTNTTYSAVDISTWVQQLNERLEILRDSASLTNVIARQKQNTHTKNSRSTRSYKPGDLVFSCIPGCRANLQASWEGPFKIIKSIPPLNYEIQDPSNTWSRITHINNLKSYQPLPTPKQLQVQAACLVAEENKEMSQVLVSGPSLVGGPCLGYSQGEMDQLLHNFDSVFSPTPGEAQVPPFKIKIQDDAIPSSRPPYQVPIHLREEVNSEIDKLINSNITEPSDSVDWCAPIVPVRKPDKSIRLRVDYREINKITPLDRHVIPTLPEILDRIGQATVLSKIDLTSGFHQILVEPQSRDHTTFLSPKGKFRFVRMPFGLKNAPSHFQRCMEKVLQLVMDCAAVYIDDIVVFSQDWPSHVQHLTRVFECFKQAHLTAKPSKCSFGKTQLQYLGHNIGSGKIVVPEHRITALAEYKRPTTKKTLRSFLGCMSYYRKFIANYSDMSALLTPSTSVSAPKVVVWTVDMDKAFSRLKVSLCNHVSLTIPSVTDTFTLHTDASGFGIGACLHIQRDHEELPVAFFSRQLQDAERRYSITELETLAIVASIKHFQFYIYGTTLNVFTDHKACTTLLNSTALNTRLKRMALFLQDKDIYIHYRPGKESANADGLSRQFDDSSAKNDTNSSSPCSLPQVQAAGGCGSSGATAGIPPSTPPLQEQ